MVENDYQDLVEEVIEENQYLALSTTDGTDPWVAPIEYFRDEAGNFYFFSTTDSRHAQHIEANDTVAVAVWGQDQPDYSSDLTTTLNGVQIRGEASRLSEAEYPEIVEAALEALGGTMPPSYAAFKIEPQRVYAPVVEDGVNKRVEVDMG